MGDMKVQTFEEVWGSRKADEVRAFAPTCPVNCWMVCTARESIKSHPVTVAGWVLGRKLRAHCGRQVYK